MKSLSDRLEKLEAQTNASDHRQSCLIEYDESATREEIEAMKARAVESGAKFIICLPKKRPIQVPPSMY
jgi:hypothetical protein